MQESKGVLASLAASLGITVASLTVGIVLLAVVLGVGLAVVALSDVRVLGMSPFAIVLIGGVLLLGWALGQNSSNN